MNSPFAEKAALREATSPDDLPDNMQLCHYLCSYSACGMKTCN